MKWLVHALLVLLYACGDVDARAHRLTGKDPGKLPAELEPYDPEPDAAEVPAGDAGAAAPDSGGAAPDSGAAAPQDAQAPRSDADVGQVDAGSVVPVTGSWRVTMTPVGASCAPVGPFAFRLLESQGAYTADLDLLGTLTGPSAAELGGTLGMWRAKLAVHVAGGELAGELTRSSSSCSDRWTVRGVR